MNQSEYSTKLEAVKEILTKYTDPQPKYDGMSSNELARLILIALNIGEDKIV